MEKKENFWKRILHVFYQKKEAPHYSFRKVGQMRVHNITDPKVMRAILKDFTGYQTPSFVRKTFSRLIGSALIMDEGDSWQVMHDIMAQSFSPKRITDSIAPLAIEEGNKMMDRWLKDFRAGDVEKEMRDMTGRVIMRAIFSDTMGEEEAKSILDDASETITASKEPKGFARVLKALHIPYDHAGFFPSVMARVLGISHDKAGSVPQSYIDAGNRVDKILYRIIAERRALAEQPDDMLGNLINARRPDGNALTDKELRDQILMLIVTGHETTAEALTFAIQEVLRHPGTEKELRDEFNAVAKNGVLTGKDFNKLVKTQNIFKEALRLHPTVYMITRESHVDQDFGDVHIKKNDLIRMDLRTLHHNAELWPEPEAFKPERFDKDKFPQAYMPFGAGPRVCIGFSMSMMESTLILSQMFNRANMGIIKSPEGEQYFFTTRPKGKLDISVLPYHAPQPPAPPPAPPAA